MNRNGALFLLSQSAAWVGSRNPPLPTKQDISVICHWSLVFASVPYLRMKWLKASQGPIYSAFCQLKDSDNDSRESTRGKQKRSPGEHRNAFCPTCPPFFSFKNLRLTRALQKGQKGRTQALRRSAQAQKRAGTEDQRHCKTLSYHKRSNFYQLGYQFARRTAARRIAAEGTVAYQMTAEALKRLDHV